MSEIDFRELKHRGMISQRDGTFSVRLRIAGGYVPSNYLSILKDVSEKYGVGNLHLTTRQGIEIPGVNFDELGEVRSELEAAGIKLGVTGPTVRTVTACQGDTCQHGIIPAQILAKKIDEEFYGSGGLPHKFKIGITGCPNACIKPYENDLGIMGVVKVEFNHEKCTLCGACAMICPTKAVKIENKVLICDEKVCIGCGKCAKVCRFDMCGITKTGYRIYVGGKMGRTPHLGHIAFDFLEGEDKLFNLIKETLEFYKQFGNTKERFADTIDRVGLGKYQSFIKYSIE